MSVGTGLIIRGATGSGPHQRSVASAPSGRGTPEVRGLVDAARALVLRDLRIRTQRTGPIDLSSGGVRSDDGIRGLALLDPSLEEADLVECVGSFAAAAMGHAGREEHTDAIRSVRRAAQALHDAVVVLDR